VFGDGVCGRCFVSAVSWYGVGTGVIGWMYDSFVTHVISGELFGEAFQLLKPGAHGFVRCESRVSHRVGVLLESSGFELRDMVMEFGVGSVVWWLIRKPLSEGTIVENVLVHGTGAINVDGCRIETTDHLGGGAYGQARKEKSGTWQSSDRSEGKGSGLRPGGAGEFTNPLGRYPSNVIFGHREGCGGGVCISGCPIRELDSQSGETRSGNGAVTASCFERPDGKAGNTYTGNDWMGKKVSGLHYADAGGASRFFYQGDAVEYLTQLITPKGGRVLLVSV